MDYVKLGNTGIEVSKLCFGTLTMSPIQKNLSISEGAGLLRMAYEIGIDFFDTAEIYENYEYLKKAFNNTYDITIATKSYSYDLKSARKSLEKARKELDRETIDIFLLHEQESELTLKGHREAIDFFLKKKQEGIIGAFGISTHHIEGIKSANMHEEIDIIHTVLNKTGVGIVDGNVEDMLEQIEVSKNLGKGIYTMKPLGGGHLISDRIESLNFVLDQRYIDSVAIGIQNKDELLYDESVFSGNTPSEALEQKTKEQARELFIHHDWCVLCEDCIKRCAQGALNIVNDKIVIDKQKCVLCSYCSTACKELAIKII